MFACIPIALIAQNSTNSPYTRYGYGMLADRSFGAGRSMGGVGYGLRSSMQINPMNPASYTSMDSLTFLFDAGASMYMSWFNDGISKQKKLNGNLEYMAMQFPLYNWLGMSIGILPYSHVGYSFGRLNEGNVTYVDQYAGTGGLHEMYLGLSVDLWKKRLALGANLSYMFGKIDHQSSTILSANSYNLYTSNRIKINDIKYDIGLQYTHPYSRTKRLVWGIAYTPKQQLHTTSYRQTANDASFSNIVSDTTITNQRYDIPHSFGTGLSFVKDYKLTLAADVSWQQWSQVQFAGEEGGFKNRIKVALGGEYIPNYFTRLYLNRIRYRAGLHYSNSYVWVKNAGYKEYGVCLGAGFPVMDNRSFINASFEYVKTAADVKTLVDEQYFRFTLSYTFNELWFLKRKMD
jgi:hypothetical protein